jgi:hypothetical protein
MALRVLAPGVQDDAAPGVIEGELSALLLGQAATGILRSAGTPAPAFAVTAGALPEGVTLDPATGAFGGAPTQVGDYAFTVVAENGIGDPATREFTGTVRAAPTIPTDPGQGDGGDGNGSGGDRSGTDGALAVTGLVLGWSLAVAIALLIAGALVRGLARRRRLGDG